MARHTKGKVKFYVCSYDFQSSDISAKSYINKIKRGSHVYELDPDQTYLL